ncbi:biopolymer transporter ExbD [Pseudacidovorax sp. RU35E]|uniref:ExbD/TolR family protein n=1 Tax=Pseudacidovorax sp. RU35E TaxID=1907403 RepID=UPI0009546D67|nr:biopolymer transporter ExbD [Pseudacidovorax sp. RU35E]SIQ36536.1 biopolymer transport protein TolR [Pseudacidovorax sp. RU35E]
MAFGRSTDRLSPRTGPPARPMADINVTPLVDVMLVLLVIFIVTAPLMASSIRLDLPAAGAAAPVEQPRTISVALDAQGRLFVDDQPVADTQALAQRLRTAAAGVPDIELQLRADRSRPYGEIVTLMDAAREAGIQRIGFVAEPGASPMPAIAPR